MKRIALLLLSVTCLPCVAISQNTISRGFFDITLSKTGDSKDGGTFAIGQYDHFLTSKLSENVTFLGETVFEYDDGWIIDVERVWIRYSFADYANISAGKFHTALGYWNRSYHHGALLHTSIDRPSYLFFEDEGGILPIHTVGVLFSGANIGKLNFGYDFMVGNGIGSDPTEDNDKAKSVSGYFHIKPVRGLDVGISFYKDRIAAGVLKADEATAIPNTVDQLLLGASFAYTKNNIEFLSEYVRIRNKDTVTEVSGNTDGLYFLTSYLVNSFSPYFKFDIINFSSQEPYFSGKDLKVFTGGIKYDVNYLAAVKFEIRVSDRNAGSDLELASQFAIAF